MRLRLCDACRRQLNVSGLAPGQTVRCVCGALLAVGVAPDLVVEGLVCGHCGAPVAREDGRCAHCHAGLSERDRVASLLCPTCGTRLPEDSHHCKACGVQLRPQAITALRDGAECPACRGPLVVRLTDELEVVECEACHGVWIGVEALRSLSERAARSEARSHLADTAAPAVAPRGYVPCVTCGELMTRRQFRYRDRPSGVVVDQCKDHGVWFDGGELAAALRFVRDAQDGPQLTVPDVVVRPIPKRPPRRPSRPAVSDAGWGYFLVEVLAGILVHLWP
jgi:Zn-finger nucleic acid-binding protein/ribosomal protein L40E